MNTLFLVISAVWIISEIILSRVKKSAEKSGSQNRDASTLKLLWLVIVGSVILGVFAGSTNIGLIASIYRLDQGLGIALIILGLIIRWTAIFSLKKYFTVNVAIVEDHRIVDRGLYAHIRHPSYLGSLLSFAGLGIALSNWLSFLIITIPITLAFLKRIKVEEAILNENFGDAYEQYCQKTKRLIPKIY